MSTKPLNALGALPPSLAVAPLALAVPADSLAAALIEALDDFSEALPCREDHGGLLPLGALWRAYRTWYAAAAPPAGSLGITHGAADGLIHEA
ncbi:hypothetical protein VE02_05093, partial [Pseudogymnoascus sp. 03VT05]